MSFNYFLKNINRKFSLRKMINSKLDYLLKLILPYKSELVWIVLGLIVQLFSGVFIIKILTKFLDTESFGTLSLLNSILQFIEIIVFSSLIQGASRFSYYLKNISHSFEFAKKYIIKIFYILIMLSFLLALYFLLIDKSIWVYYLFLLIVLIYLDVNRDLIIAIFHMNRSRKIVTLFKSLDQLLRLLSVVIIGFVGITSLTNIYLGYILITIVLVLLLSNKKKILQKNENIRFDNIENESKYKLKKKIVGFAIPFALISIFTWLLTWADRWVLNTFLPIEKVGIYSANSQIANVPFMIISSIALTFFAPILFSKAENIRNSDDFLIFKLQINKILIFYILASIVTIILLQLVQNNILHYLLSSKFVIKGNLFILISLGWLLFQVAQVHATLYLYTTSDSRAVLYSSVISGIIYILALFILVNKFGEVGAAYSFIISNIFRILVQHILSKFSWNRFKKSLLVENFDNLNL